MVNNFKEEHVPINGISQYFLHILNPNKDILIMLHGGPGIPNSYAAYYHQSYLNFCNVVYYDQRGAGKTQLKNKSEDESLCLDVLLEDLKQTIQYAKDKYDANRIFLVGHSWGSVLGTQYILKYPHDVSGYIGYGQYISMSRQDRNWYKNLKGKIFKLGTTEDIKKFNAVDCDFPNIEREKFDKGVILLSELEAKYGYKASDWIEIYEKSPIMTLEDWGMIEEEFSQKLASDVFYDYDICNTREYQVPVYYILGRYDEWTSSVIVEEYFNTINAPQKGLYWIENAGHMMDTDNPKDFFDAIQNIIKQL